MTVDARAVLTGCRRLGLVTVLLAPFRFGAVGLDVWPPLATLWIGLGVTSLAASRRIEAVQQRLVHPMPRIMAGLYLLFALQLVPLPSWVARSLSPGSFAAHFIPTPATEVWAPLTASPTGTWQALLFVAGLHGLSLALFAGSAVDHARRLRTLFLGMAGVGSVLALEGLVQSASAHPHWLYGLYPVPGIGSHEAGVFGPYYNRDHFSNLIAIAGSVTAALLALAAREGGFGSLTAFSRSPAFARNLGLVIGLLLMIVVSAASGSRGGLVALFVGVLVGLAPAMRARPRLAFGGLVVLAIALFGTGAPAAFVRMSNIDFEASRLLVWRDALRLIEFFPLFGCGIGAFAPAYWPYQRVVRFEYWPHLHNEYMQWILEGGLLGMGIAFYALRLAFRALPGMVRTLETRPALAGLAAAMTHALVDCGFRIPANAAWAAVLLVSLSLTFGEATVRRNPTA